MKSVVHFYFTMWSLSQIVDRYCSTPAGSVFVCFVVLFLSFHSVRNLYMLSITIIFGLHVILKDAARMASTNYYIIQFCFGFTRLNVLIWSKLILCRDTCGHVLHKYSHSDQGLLDIGWKIAVIKFTVGSSAGGVYKIVLIQIQS